MKKVLIAQIAFLLVLAIGVMLLGIEIFARHMDPDKMILFAVVTGAGLLGACACTLWRVYAQWAGKK